MRQFGKQQRIESSDEMRVLSPVADRRTKQACDRIVLDLKSVSDRSTLRLIRHNSKHNPAQSIQTPTGTRSIDRDYERKVNNKAIRLYFFSQATPSLSASALRRHPGGVYPVGTGTLKVP